MRGDKRKQRRLPDTEELFNDRTVRRLDELLRLYALKPKWLPELAYLLMTATVMLWIDEDDDGVGPFYCIYKGRGMQPCFTSLESLRAAEQEYGKHAMMAAPIAGIRGIGAVVINLMSPHVMVITPETGVELPTVATPEVPKHGLH